MKVYLILDNVRSCHNVGALLRTCDGLGVDEVALCGFTPYPARVDDSRPKYLTAKIDRRIHKTALGAELTQKWRHFETASAAINSYRRSGAQIVALEQTASALAINKFKPAGDIALILGNEIKGVSSEALELSDLSVMLSMKGSKESFNVSSAGAMALFYIKLMV